MPSFDLPLQPGRKPQLIPLEVPVPPEAVRTFGYPGGARFVGFLWEPAGDEVVYDDGQLSGIGASHAFLTYRRHPAVVPHLETYDLGYSDLEAAHCLILDRELSRAVIATRADARAFLRGQHAPPSATELSPSDLEEARSLPEGAFATGWQEVTIDPAKIRAAMTEERRSISEMVTYLDRFTPPS